MDVTDELWACCEQGDVDTAECFLTTPSPFVLMATDLLRQIEANEHYMQHIYEDYVDYHRYLRREDCDAGSALTDDERHRIGKEVALFVASVASDVQELHRIVRFRASASSEETTHYEEILAHLTKVLDKFIKNHKMMQRERERLALNPFRLLTESIDSGKFATARTLAKLRDHAENPHLDDVKNSMAAGAISDQGGRLSRMFVERYESEVAKPSILKKYDDIVSKQKASLMKEAKHLNVRFSEELREVASAEASSMQLSSMLTDFLGILGEQSGQVDVVSGSGKAATEAVKQTDAELLLTLERTESHQKNMVLLACTLALLLLLLDWASP